MKILKEITDWDVEYRQPNHTYLVNAKGKILAYAKWHSKTDVQVFNSRHELDKRRRKFVEVKHAALSKIAKSIVEEMQKEEIIVGEKFVVKSESGNSYTVVLNAGRYSCSCIGFGYRGKCKHIEQVRKENE